MELTPEEANLVEYAKQAVVKYNTIRHNKGGIDTLYSFVLSDGGKIYDGASYESNSPHLSICAERHAIANLILAESYSAEIKSIVVVDPVPEVQENSTPPCGSCRQEIWTHGYPETSVILMQYVQRKNGWAFPKIEKFFIKDLYPRPYEHKEGLWDNFEPK